MFNQIYKLLAGDPHKRTLTAYQKTVDQINALEPEMENLSDQALQDKTLEFKEIIAKKLESTEFKQLIAEDVPKMPGQLRTSHDVALQEVLDEILVEAFAVCREASRRVLGMRHYDVQLLGGIQIHNGGIAEMQTGEGKTLVCTLPTYLNALSNRGVHVITVNDYLARRDSEWMGKLYGFLGLSTGLVIPGKTPIERQAAYRSDITYGTNNEFGFDYLRDNMETGIEECVQKPYSMAIVDEVDSILIDEARTPLIISGMPDANKRDIYLVMAKIAPRLKKAAHEKDKSDNAHYYVDEKAKNVILNDAGIQEAEKLLKVDDLWDPATNLAHHLIQALRAKELFTKDVDYIVATSEKSKQKEITIVDEFTGRLMEGRRWGDGLHQAIEAKESVAIQEETLTMASITFQNLFRLYPKLSGMTGTAQTEAEEFEKIYNLNVLPIPTNKECIRLNLNDVVFKTERAKFFALVEDVVEQIQNNRPVLVGTTSIDKSEYIAELLTKPLHVLDIVQFRIQRLLHHAHKQNKLEALSPELKKLLDKPGNITSAKVNPELDKLEEALKMDEDTAFALKSLRSAVNVLGAVRSKLDVKVLNAKHHAKEAQIIRQAGKPGAVTIATNMAGRGTDIILGGYKSNDEKSSDYDVVDLEAQEKVLANGGLHVIGSERHESRRVDNQLRGRCSRQGDPGSSRFYLSLEDNLMRIFGGDKVMSVMTMLNADEDLPIEAGLITGAINNSQKKVEAHHFDMRKHVLQYDDVNNTQREVIYRERRQILEGKDIQDSIKSMIDDYVDNLVYSHLNPNQPADVWFDDSRGVSPITAVFESLKSELGEEAAVKLPNPEIFKEQDFNASLDQIKATAQEVYLAKETQYSPEAMRAAERQIMLHVIDTKWVEHLHSMDSLKDGINLQAYGQKDPLIEYKKEAFDMFDELLANIRKDTVMILFHAQIVEHKGEKVMS